MTMPKRRYQAILLDSGRVLNEPATGHWFIPPRFFEYIDRSRYHTISSIRRAEAFRQSQAYLNRQVLIRTEAEELSHAVHFYRLFSEALPELKLDEQAINDLASDLVYNPEKYRFYPDVMSQIPRLGESCKLAVVSDAWPSLERVYREAGLREWFSSFVISSQLGVSKPDPAMYRAALEELGVPAEQALFIDDHPRNCEGARQLGISVLVMNRNRRAYAANRLIHWRRHYSYVRDLAEARERFLQE